MKSTRRSATNNPSTLKQGTLGFISIKRTASTAPAKGKKHRKVLSTPTPADEKGESIEDVTPSPEASDPIESSSADDSAEIIREKRPLPKRTDASAVRKGVLGSRDRVENLQPAVEGKTEDLDLRNVSGKWRNHYGVVRRKMGFMEPVHPQGQTKVHNILRVFDLSYEYGPCIGVSRLERWERASALGLNPPIEVREILLTKQGLEETQYSQCVFHDEV